MAEEINTLRVSASVEVPDAILVDHSVEPAVKSMPGLMSLPAAVQGVVDAANDLPLVIETTERDVFLPLPLQRSRPSRKSLVFYRVVIYCRNQWKIQRPLVHV